MLLLLVLGLFSSFSLVPRHHFSLHRFNICRLHWTLCTICNLYQCLASAIIIFHQCPHQHSTKHLIKWSLLFSNPVYMCVCFHFNNKNGKVLKGRESESGWQSERTTTKVVVAAVTTERYVLSLIEFQTIDSKWCNESNEIAIRLTNCCTAIYGHPYTYYCSHAFFRPFLDRL